jgi:mycothiol system anti-sigma-R factor
MKEVCKETLERAFLFLDGEVLSATERAEIRVHLEDCEPCFERYGLQAEVSALVAGLRNYQRCPDELRSRITALFRR